MSGRKHYSGKWDGLSVAVSLLCLVHCVALPLLVSILPLSGIVGLNDPKVEWVALSLTAAIGGWAIWKGYQHHRQWTVGVAFLTGLVVMAIASLVPAEPAELVLKTLGAALIIGAHLRNLAEGRRCCALPG